MLVSSSLFISRDFWGESPLGKQAMNFCEKLKDLVLLHSSVATDEGGGKNWKPISAECLLPSRNYEHGGFNVFIISRSISQFIENKCILRYLDLAVYVFVNK